MSLLQGTYGNTQHPIGLSPDASITVLNPSNDSQIIKVKAIFDTAAMMTCLPKSQVETLDNLTYIAIPILVRYRSYLFEAGGRGQEAGVKCTS